MSTQLLGTVATVYGVLAALKTLLQARQMLARRSSREVSARFLASYAGGYRRRRRYLRDSAKKLSEAACAGDPVAALSDLGDLCQAECQTPGQRVKSAEETGMAEMLMRACRQSALGQDPAPVTPRSW